MASPSTQKRDQIDRFIDRNLKKVFSDLEKDDMPDRIADLMSVLRAQDKEQKQ